MNRHNITRAPWRFLAAITVFVCSLVSTASSQWNPPIEGRVTDVAHVLSVSDRDRLITILAGYEQETSHQLAVLVVPTLHGERIESFSLRVANAWRLGQKGLDNGVLVTLAMKEREVRIELGLGMEKYISNATAQSIINEVMVPAFGKGDYAGGLEAGLELLMKYGRQFVVTPADLHGAKER